MNLKFEDNQVTYFC